jgi:hypothetical protein
MEDNLSNLPARNQSGVHESERRKERQKLLLLTSDAVYFVLIFHPCSLTMLKIRQIHTSLLKGIYYSNNIANNNAVVVNCD